jgi:hypothetical protein
MQTEGKKGNGLTKKKRGQVDLVTGQKVLNNWNISYFLKTICRSPP